MNWAAIRCFDNTIALLAVQYSSAMKSEHLPATFFSRVHGRFTTKFSKHLSVHVSTLCV